MPPPPPPSPPPPPPLINVGHKLVHFQSCTLFLICFPQTTLNGGRGLQKNPESVRKSELKHKTLYCPNEFAHDCRLSYIIPELFLRILDIKKKLETLGNFRKTLIISRILEQFELSPDMLETFHRQKRGQNVFVCILTNQERGQSVHIRSLSAVIHQKGSYSASKHRFLTIVLESKSLFDSKYGRLCRFL